ncbi:hydroxyethylthiazole kinase [Senegalia massiliensis]|jgi:hydroxyethylthiazole kinase|uniref:hydroxyethylthiazole kinase n=1 Tax=Senegalia massiliensis TaxID=1720316 RepID=UPI0010320120|nr:hydroxyethylthiazole kinase [Senegalia massiliensis]
MFKEIYENVQHTTPLVHSITNYVTVNDCANIVLAAGGSPIMADGIEEVAEINSICDALVINIGTLNERVIKSMIKAGKKANEIGNPVILDPVAVGASQFRNEVTFKLLEEIQFSVIRGNASEIKTIYEGSGTTSGVDANEEDKVEEKSLDNMITLCKNLSKKTGAIIALTGAIDIVASDKNANIIYNGHYLMSKVTGTGCMLTNVIGTYCGANKNNILDSTSIAVAHMGLAGEVAFKKLQKADGGTSSYRMFLIDEISKMNYKKLKEGANIENR